MAYEVTKENENKELLSKILKELQIYEKSCIKKNETSSPAKIKLKIEELCREN